MPSYPFDQPTNEEPAREPPVNPVQQPRNQQSVQGVTTTTGQPATTPPVDVLDDGDEIWVYCDLPGFETGDIEVRGDGDSITVTADRSDDPEEGNVVARERSTRMERTIRLPAPVDVTGAEATYEGGVCTIALPKEAAGRFQDIEFDSD